ncbi:MAG TPA: hypothetical protein VNA20_12070 [Frankiaceae bacterium]|nr:hypothetical protein [Frankiaceae bacterium]
MRLAKLLASRGAAPDVVDDVVQEVAARVLAKRIAFTDAMDLMRWAVPVALNLLVDNARAGQRLTPVTDDHDQPMADVADLVAHRDRLNRVLRALPLLSDSDRAVLTGPEVVPSDRKEAVRLAVRRHRARRRLLALVDGVAAFVALAAGLLRRTGRSAATAGVAIAATPVALMLLSPGTPTPQRDVAPATADAERASVERAVSRAAAVRTVPAARPRPATASVRKAAPPAAAKAAAPRPPDEVVRVPGGTNGGDIAVTGRDRRPDDGLVCLRDVGSAGDICVQRVEPQPAL